MPIAAEGTKDAVNIHIYQSTFVHESRMLKITRSLVQQQVFPRVIIIARHEGGLPTTEEIDEQRSVRRVATWFPASGSLPIKVAGTLEWLFRVALILLSYRVSCINCHSLMVLPIGVWVKLFKGATLVYDTHELETETAKLRGLRKRLAKWTEWLFIRWADETIVVGDAIADWYQQAYPNQRIHVVRNVPNARTSAIATPSDQTSECHFRRQFAIPAESMIFLYQGALSVGRGIELLLETFSQLPSSHHLVLMGYGSYQPMIEDAARQYGNIHFHQAVKPDQLADYTRCADVGLCLIENICLSYYYSLPNKLFEYLQAGIPVIGSEFPEIQSVIKSTACGWTTPLNVSDLSQLLLGLDRANIEKTADRTSQAAANLCWEREEEKLLAIYRHQSPSSTRFQTGKDPQRKAA